MDLGLPFAGGFVILIFVHEQGMIELRQSVRERALFIGPRAVIRKGCRRCVEGGSLADRFSAPSAPPLLDRP
jgi:hypothetical protein